MTDKELRRLNRRELLEILIMQTEENEKLRNQLEKAEKELQNKNIVLLQAGSIAQAALQLNGVFEAAEKAAEQYLDSIKNMENDMRKETVSKAIEKNLKSSYGEKIPENEEKEEYIHTEEGTSRS